MTGIKLQKIGARCKAGAASRFHALLRGKNVTTLSVHWPIRRLRRKVKGANETYAFILLCRVVSYTGLQLLSNYYIIRYRSIGMYSCVLPIILDDFSCHL